MTSAHTYADELPAASSERDTVTVTIDSLAILEKYVQALEALTCQRDSSDYGDSLATVKLNPYFYQLLSTPTLYRAPMQQQMGNGDDTLSLDPQLRRLQAINRTLAGLYVSHPWLVSQTEDNLKDQTAIRGDVKEKMASTDNKLSEKVAAATLTPKVEEQIEVKTRRPNFWKFPGSTALNFTQYAYSHNWPGGENRYAGLTTLILNANYNNEKKVTWTNNLDMRLGFQTSKTDKNRAFRPTSNQIVYTTNMGIKAYKTLSYTANVRMSTKVVPSYAANTDEVYEDCLSPLDVTIGPGMGYSYAFGKKKRFTGNVNVSPLAYNIRYVQRESLVTRYGVRPGHHSTHAFGPTATINFSWTIMNQVRWTGRIYWFSNLHKTAIDWTNTLNFTINKYITATLNIHPTFDDKVRTDKGIRLEENLGLGMSYSF